MKKEHVNFLRELKALLEKYDATISFTCDETSDTAGIHDGCITLDVGAKDERVFTSAEWYLVGSHIPEQTR